MCRMINLKLVTEASTIASGFCIIRLSVFRDVLSLPVLLEI